MNSISQIKSVLLGSGASAIGCIGIVLTGFAVPLLAWADPVKPYTIDAPQRLSQWMHQRPETAQWYSLSMGWATPEEKKYQTEKRQKDMAMLRQALRQPDASALFQWLNSTPVSGRLPLVHPDKDWLEGVPARNPSLRVGDRVWGGARPQKVWIFSGEQACELRHQGGAYLADYLEACSLQLTPEAWVAQADGRIQHVSLSSWQPQRQPQLAPGARVWTGWARDQFKPGVDDLTMAQVNAVAAYWLALADPESVLPGPIAQTDFKTSSAQTGSDLTGLTGARFDPMPSASQWGTVGLIQTPTARMRPAGSINLSIQRTAPYTWVNVMFQPLPWLEGGFRYVDIANRLYGPADFSGDQSYKDKSFELKARILEEDALMPAVAVGIRDLGGTGLFGGEYLVANKRWGRLDASLGLAWGYQGGRSNLANPLSKLSSRFDKRVNDIGQAGNLSTEAYFRGPTALFAGLEYQSPWGPSFKVEYDANHYQREPKQNNQVVKSPLNFGLVHRFRPGIDLHASLERGNTLGLGISFWTDLSSMSTPKIMDKRLSAVQLTYPENQNNWQQTLTDMEQFTGWRVRQLAQQGNTLSVQVESARTIYLAPQLQKAMVVAHRDAPQGIEKIVFQHMVAQDVVAVDAFDRQNWLRTVSEPARTSQPESAPSRGDLTAIDKAGPDAKLLAQSNQNFSLRPSINLKHNLGGPEGFLLYSLDATLDAQAQLPLGMQIRGQARHRLFSNYDRFNYQGSSQLPRVRTYAQEYEGFSRTALSQLYLLRVVNLSRQFTSSFYGGYLEPMFAGGGGEVLWRPSQSRLALGVDLNRVQQRDFKQNLNLRDYQVNTGHVTAYWETPWQDILATVKVGQYLAGDRGATVSVTKRFRNGATMGAFATKTNVSAAQFGEGSFNKGIFWSIPFDAFMPSSSNLRANFNWIPLTRDGGALLARPHSLYSETYQLSPSATFFAPAPPKERLPDER
jgi:hypothetical protein